MKKLIFVLFASLCIICCEKDKDENNNPDNVCTMCADTDGDGTIDCTCDCHYSDR